MKLFHFYIAEKQIIVMKFTVEKHLFRNIIPIFKTEPIEKSSISVFLH